MSKTYLKILKPKTRPIQIEPWFFRYLNEGQLKIVSAIIAHADYKTRKENSFASNKTLAFYAGLGQIKPGSKDEKKYNLLDEDEKIIYKKKKIKNAVRTVKNIKQELEDIGVIKREFIDGKSFAIVDLEWGKEKYLKEFDEYFNEKENTTKEKDIDINEELVKLAKLSEEGNISKDSLAKRLESITEKLTDKKSDVHNQNQTLTDEQIENIANQEMNSNKIQKRIKKGEIENPDKYKNGIKKLIKQNKFNGLEKYLKNDFQLESHQENKSYAENFNALKEVSDKIKNYLDFQRNINWIDNYYLQNKLLKIDGITIGFKDMKHPYLTNKSEIILFKVEKDEEIIDVPISSKDPPKNTS